MEYQTKTVLLTPGREQVQVEYDNFYWYLGTRRYEPDEGKVWLNVVHSKNKNFSYSFGIQYPFDCTSEWTVSQCWEAITSLEQYK